MTDETKPFHNPFAVLGGLRGGLPDRPAATPPSQEPAADQPDAAPKGLRRAVVRLERSGRGGKEVTVVEQLALDDVAREAWLKALKAALGCGGKIEGTSLVLQGDQRERLPALLTKRGVKRITIG